MTSLTARPTGLTRQAGLRGLEHVRLSSRNQSLLDAAGIVCNGSKPWRVRKEAEARSLLSLSQIATPGRLRIKQFDMTEALRVLLVMDVPVPTWDPKKGFAVGRGAILGLQYREQALIAPQPGMSYIGIIKPAHVFHANVSAENAAQPLCLGATLPAGITCVNLVLMTWSALSMQSVAIDEYDPAGVLHLQAAQWWQANRHRIPLTHEPFLGNGPAESSVGSKGGET